MNADRFQGINFGFIYKKKDYCNHEKKPLQKWVENMIENDFTWRSIHIITLFINIKSYIISFKYVNSTSNLCDKYSMSMRIWKKHKMWFIAI